MSLKNFISKLFKEDRIKSLQQENERLKIELRVLEKLEKELKDNHPKINDSKVMF